MLHVTLGLGEGVVVDVATVVEVGVDERVGKKGEVGVADGVAEGRAVEVPVRTVAEAVGWTVAVADAVPTGPVTASGGVTVGATGS